LSHFSKHCLGRLFVFKEPFLAEDRYGKAAAIIYEVYVRLIEALPMERLKILLVSEDRCESLSLSAMLQNLGHTAITCAHDVSEAVSKTSALSPDLVVVDVTMDDCCGLQTATGILEQHALPIVLITSFIEPELIDQADALGISGYMAKPVSQKDIQSVLVLARSRFKYLQSLRSEILDLKNMMRTRKLIEQAKGLLMERESIPEAEAFKRIQCMSRNQNIPMAAISEAIIMTDRLTHKTKVNRNRSRERRGGAQEYSQE
jgi:response regulator NasT